jgi:hypothetical protein
MRWNYYLERGGGILVFRTQEEGKGLAGGLLKNAKEREPGMKSPAPANDNGCETGRNRAGGCFGNLALKTEKMAGTSSSSPCETKGELIPINTHPEFCHLHEVRADPEAEPARLISLPLSFQPQTIMAKREFPEPEGEFGAAGADSGVERQPNARTDPILFFPSRTDDDRAVPTKRESGAERMQANSTIAAETNPAHATAEPETLPSSGKVMAAGNCAANVLTSILSLAVAKTQNGIRNTETAVEPAGKKGNLKTETRNPKHITQIAPKTPGPGSGHMLSSAEKKVVQLKVARADAIPPQ